MTLLKQNGLYRIFSRRLDAWLNARVPAERVKRLDHRSIFIFPSVAGIVFLILLLILLVAAINYQNNMLYAFTFLLGAVFAVSILHCYRNLSGLSVSYVSSRGCFPGERATFRFCLNQPRNGGSEAIELGWPEQGPLVHTMVPPGAITEVELTHSAVRRGILKPARLLVQSSYPLGLIRAWSWLSFNADAVVYPKPIEAPPAVLSGEGNPEGEVKRIAGNDDYYGLRQFVAGDSLKRVAWKQFAQKGELFTKEFVAYQGQSLWLNLQDYPGQQIELKLSFLCCRVLALAKQQQPFGLRLGSAEIPPGMGEAHTLQCLESLGRYGTVDEAQQRVVGMRRTNR